MRDQVADGVGDAHQKGVEALLREDLVEDVGEPPVRLDEGRVARRALVSSSRRWVGRTTTDPPIDRSSDARSSLPEVDRSGRTKHRCETAVHESLVRVNAYLDASPR